MAVHVEGLWKTHPGAAAPTLCDLSFTVQTGSLAAILGRSGAGKSTLLRVLSGLDPFDKGRIDVAGVVVEGGAPSRALFGRVGLVFQSLELFPHLSVLENCVLAPVRARGLARQEAEAKARALLADLELGDKATAHPEALSGGQRQRAAIVRALMVEPQVLLYDEPTSALDPSLKLEVQKTLARVAERTQMTQIVVTHDPAFAGSVAQSVFVLEEGRLRPDTPKG